MAAAFAELVLQGGPVPEGREFYVLVARYGLKRLNDLPYLQQLAGMEIPKRLTTQEVAAQSFISPVCPACGGEKRPGKDWFCKKCWQILPKDLTSKLWRGFKGRDLPEYLRALAILKQEGRKPAEAVNG